MFNFFINTPENINGGVYRYQEFFAFCDKNNIPYTINQDITNEDNIIDIDYFSMGNDYVKGNIFYGAMRRYIYHKIKFPDRKHYTHNLYYANLTNGIFLPMFIYDTHRYRKQENIKYKYGMFSTIFDSNFPSIDYLLKECNISCEDILLLDRENLMSAYGYETTQNTEYFLNSVENIIDVVFQYSTRHVFSRFYAECMIFNKPMYFISINDTTPISFRNFKHIKYNKLKKINSIISIIKAEYDIKYFMLSSYSEYIKYVSNNLCNNIVKLDYVEDYSNGK